MSLTKQEVSELCWNMVDKHYNDNKSLRDNVINVLKKTVDKINSKECDNCGISFHNSKLVEKECCESCVCRSCNDCYCYNCGRNACSICGCEKCG